MTAADLVLKFEITEGRNPDASIAADALAAWVELLRTAAQVVEPSGDVRIELVGVEKGSQAFLFAIGKVREFGRDVSAGMDEFPLVKKAAITLSALVTSTAITVFVQNALTSDPKIPPEQMAVFTEMRDLMKTSVELQRQHNRFYGVLQSEPAYERIDVLNPDRTVAYSVPRSDFAARSGVWAGEDMVTPPQTEVRTATWDVVLIKPVLVSEPRKWRFAREGLEFSALMQDEAFLVAIHDRTLPVQVAEGVMMKVEVTYRERFEGSGWVPVSGSHKVKRVLSPLPPRADGPLFSSDAP